jgi:tRNA A22 N-methylase
MDVDASGVADIGTDHGLLAVGLAVTGRFETVVGVDLSSEALINGAHKLHEEILEHRKQRHPDGMSRPLPVEFRCGDGLTVLQAKEADAVCIAGVGVNTILDVLKVSDSDRFLLDKLDCQHIIVQPTNSRPRHLMRLYYSLVEIGWEPQAERIAHVSSRWYMTTLFSRNNNSKERTARAYLPGELLVSFDTPDQKIPLEWICHHSSWIRRDRLAAGQLGKQEARWLEAFHKLAS